MSRKFSPKYKSYSTMTKETKMILFSLIGVLVPFGTIWMPFLVTMDNHKQKSFRLIYVTIIIIFYLIGLGLSVKAWLSFFYGKAQIPTWSILAPIVSQLFVILIFLPISFMRSKSLSRCWILTGDQQ